MIRQKGVLMPMQKGGFQEHLKGCLLVSAILLLVSVLLCGLVGAIGMYVENRRLEEFADGLYSYPLPPDTTVLGQHSEIGKVGNGNNCWYRAEQSMVSTLSREEIEAYYADVTLPRVSFGRWDSVYASIRDVPVELEFEQVGPDGRIYFRVVLFDVGLDVNLDPRCH